MLSPSAQAAPGRDATFRHRTTFEQPGTLLTSIPVATTPHGFDCEQWSIAATPDVCQPVRPDTVTSDTATASVSFAHVPRCWLAGQ